MLRQWLRRPGAWIVAIAAAFAVFVGLNVGLKDVASARLDLTEKGLYTLSEGTVEMLRESETPVALTLYLSSGLVKQAPSYSSFVQRVQDLLTEMSTVAGDDLTVETVDPEPFSPAADAAVDAGLEGVQLNPGGDKYYFGLAAKRLEPAGGTGGDGASDDSAGRDAIATFKIERQQFLEYDVAKLIHGLIAPEKPVVGVVSSSEMFGSFQKRLQRRPTRPWAVVAQAREFFRVERMWQVDDFRRVDPDVLAIVHPANLSDRMLYEIDQYLLRGGKAVMFIDPWHETAKGGSQMGGMMAVPPESDLSRILDHWGVEIPEGTVIGDRSMGRRVNAGDQDNIVPAPYIAWLQTEQKHFNPDHPLTSDANGLLMPSPGRVGLAKDSGLTLEPLVRTTTQATKVDTEKLSPPDILGLLEDYEPLGARQTLAAQITGRVTTAFPDGRPPKPEPESESKTDGEGASADGEAGTDGGPADSADGGTQAAADGDGADEGAKAGTGESKAEKDLPPPPAHVAASRTPLDVVMVADADMLVDRYWVRQRQFQGQQVAVPFNDNGTFFINALEYLAGSDELMSLRSRGTGERPFEVIHDLRREAEQAYRAREQELRDQMGEIQDKLARVREGKAGEKILGDKSREAAMQDFTDRLVKTRKELRQVTHNLREDIESLKTWIEFVNIGLIPLLLTIFALGLWGVRLRLRRRSMRG